MSDRYAVPGVQSEFQPDSDGRVRVNALGVMSCGEMDELELTLLQQLYEDVLARTCPIVL